MIERDWLAFHCILADKESEAMSLDFAALRVNIKGNDPKAELKFGHRYE